MPPPNRSKVPIGTVLEGKFRVTKEIGRGGMAAVYEAQNIDIGKRVAVKILAAELLTSRVVRERFIREARAAAAIRSPYICDVYDSGMYEERPFLVMELLEGESLYDLLTRVRQVDVDTTLTMAVHSCRGLTKAHEMNVVHRDLKPENIFLTHSQDGELVVKLLDFGLAKFYEPTGGDAAQARLTREGALFGTPAYMSPEQAKGQGEVDHRCDLWALGCIVYECLTGQTVWNVDQGVAMILAQIAGAPLPRPSRLRPDLPKAFDQWFLRALDRNPDKRYQTPKEFSDALNEALKPTPGSAREPLVSSDVEGEVVDRLISGELSNAAIPSSPGSQPLDQLLSAPAAAPAPPSPQDFGLAPPSTPTRAAPARGSSRPTAALIAVAAVVLGGYALWFYVLHPPPARPALPTKSAAVPALSSTVDAGSPAEALVPREHDAYALQIASAQKWLYKGKRANALAMFHEAFLNGGTSVARALFGHAGVALAPNKDKCKVTGLGRPRPFDLTDSISRPSLALTPAGLVVSWVDSHQDVHRRQAYATVLDATLERVSPVRLITPEASFVRDARLIAAGNKLVFVYWDAAGDEPGVYVRLLDTEGRIAGPARRIASAKHGELSPSLARAGDGSFWAVWTEEMAGSREDVMAEKLGNDLQPAGKPVRLTAFTSQRGASDNVENPDVAIANGQLYVVFAFEHRHNYEIMRLRIALSDPALSTGVTIKKKRYLRPEDLHIGDLRAVIKSHAKNAEPRIACTKEGCFVVWDDDRKGAIAAFLDKDTGQAIWHREFGVKGSRPNVASSSSGALVAWFDDARVKVARISRDGLDKPSVLAKESGYQPSPAIVPGSDSGQWYISWRDYEAGHLEAFVVRAQCK